MASAQDRNAGNVDYLKDVSVSYFNCHFICTYQGQKIGRLVFVGSYVIIHIINSRD